MQEVSVIKNRTTVVIAHRLSTILNSDRIFVMNQGVLVEGKHEELLINSKIYENFYKKQINKINRCLFIGY